MTIIDELKKRIELYDDQDWQKILDEFSNIDDDILSEIAIIDLKQLTSPYQFEEHYVKIQLNTWNKFCPTYRNNVMMPVLSTLGHYINFILYLNNPRKWCDWLDNFCDYVKVAFIQCLLSYTTIMVDHCALLELAFERENYSLAHFLTYAYICSDDILDDTLISCLIKHQEDIISIIMPVLSDFHFSAKFKNKMDPREPLIKALGVRNIISTIMNDIKKKIDTNSLKGEFFIWTKCLEMINARPDHEFSELYCQWLDNFLRNRHDLIYEINTYKDLEQLEWDNIISISYSLDDCSIEKIKLILDKSFVPYGGWSDPSTGWKRNHLFQHAGLLLWAMDVSNDDLINFILEHIYKIIPFVLNKSEYELLLICISSYPWDEEHKSLNTLIRIINTIDAPELIENLQNRYLEFGGKSSVLLGAFSAQIELLKKFNQN